MSASHHHFQWDSCALTHQGCVRDHNEDAGMEWPEIGLWVVADGMGGHSSGDLASNMIIDHISHLLLPEKLSDIIDLLEDTLEEVNQQLLQTAQQRGGNTTIGSTVVVMLVYNNLALLLWVGDSRAYLFREGQLTRLTQDHTQVEELIEQGLLLREDAEKHPSANIITRAVGATEDFFVDITSYEIREGDIFLLCSDGLDKEVNEQEISELLGKTGSAKQLAQSLLDLTLERGARDNVTITLAKALKYP
ncbi:MAG: Stp1/IreP family PP2C-type Ser/Thr phosphatase [Candidatus Polarisedimenticolaceae bacterium]|nr:Stp1/IreP family PP2C-type Ser/Thr phosphatase [Candidatus Polarisedimenticolaceae bacterium]